MGRVFWGLLVLLVFPCAARAAEVTSLPLAGDNAPAVVLWTAEQSLPEGPLADPRLDQPVRFWRAALSMEEVAAGIQQQTGVEVRFWPPGDVNRRVRVNLYLDPKSPPTLRDLLAQLGWVLGCNLAVTEGAPRGYYVLASEKAGDILGAMEREQAQRVAQQRAEGMATLQTRLEEYRPALELPRDQVIARYAENERRVAYDLLEPHRHAALRFLLSLPPAEQQQLFSSGEMERQARELTPEQRDAVQAALGVDGLPADCVVRTSANGFGWGVGLAAETWMAPDAPNMPRPVGTEVGYLAISHYPSAINIEMHDDVALRRLMGETISEEEEAALTEEAIHRYQAALRTDAGFRARWLAEPVLSLGAREQLSSLSLEWHPESEYALWQVQEAVAVLTGRDIVSDCFLQPRSKLDGNDAERLDPTYRGQVDARRERYWEWVTRRGGRFDLDDATEEQRREFQSITRPQPASLPLLHWLLLICGHSTRSLLVDPLAFPTGWEWGDAGRFLRFRSVYRDALREALLPPQALAQAEALVTPVLADVDFANAPPAAIAIDRKPEVLADLARPLSELQLRYGPHLIYEDPATPRGAAEMQGRNWLGEHAGELGVPLLQFLGSLSSKQWEKLRGAGLNCGRDLTPGQQQSRLVQKVLEETAHDPRVTPGPSDLVVGLAGFAPDRVSVFHAAKLSLWSFDGVGAPLNPPLPHLVPVPEHGRGQ